MNTVDSPAADSIASPFPANHATGILPAQALVALFQSHQLLSTQPLDEGQVQPASLDLRLGARAYRDRASFLAGSATVLEKLAEFKMHEMDISDGGVLEKGCVYVVPLLESLALHAGTTAVGNPKSSTGRLDVFTRLLTDYGTEFDRVRDGYTGPLYAEISPRTFSILVRQGSRLSQLRIRRGPPTHSDPQMKDLQQQFGLVDRALGENDIRGGVPVSVDVGGATPAGSGALIGYRAKAHAGLIDLDRIGHYEIRDFWDPVYASRNHGLILDPAEFYILASREAVRVPPGYAAEMIAYDTLVGEFRVHYAGFFDPGFGDVAGGGAGSRAVLEVRSYEVPFVIEDGQIVGRLVYERLTEHPDQLYGSGLRSNY